MSIYGYATTFDNNTVDFTDKIKDYCKKQSLIIKTMVVDENSNKTHWDKRELNHLLNEELKKGDTLVTYEAANLARSTLQVLEVLDLMANKGIALHLVKYNQTYTPDALMDTIHFLELVKDIEGDFVTKRTTDALERRRVAGLPLGRPKGRKNKSRKLDKHKAEIKKYLALNISKASIAKLLGCHAQTLYNYLDDHDLMAEGEEQAS